VSKGGEDIPLDELNVTSRGERFRARNMRSSDRVKEGKAPLGLGRLNPKNAEHQWIMHLDGHAHQIGPGFPDHHAYPHVHAYNAAGVERVYVARRGGCK